MEFSLFHLKVRVRLSSVWDLVLGLVLFISDFVWFSFVQLGSRVC